MLDNADKTGGAEDKVTASRVHHSSWVVTDQARTRQFYEEVIGFPLAAFWIENLPFEGEMKVMSHAFYALPDGSALTFFNFPDAKVHDVFKSPVTAMFNHVAFNLDSKQLDLLIARLEKADVKYMIIDHGYCRSMYTIDPDGLRLEFAVDSPKVAEIVAEQAATARTTLQEWLDGRRTTNNHWRTETPVH